MNAIHDPGLVAISVLIGILAWYVALDLAMSVTLTRDRPRRLWLTSGALAMGTGIWSMHFIGMLALRFPGLSASYDAQLLVLSLSLSVAASWLTLQVVSRQTLERSSLLIAVLVIGTPFAAVHYVTGWSIYTGGAIHWEPALVAASVMIALVTSTAALAIALRVRDDPTRRGVAIRTAGAVLLGGGTALLHHTGLAAGSFVPVDTVAVVSAPELLAADGLALVIAFATMMLLLIALAGSIFERELALRSLLAEENRLLYERAQVAQQVAEAANRSKSRFLANMSHELRTPLNAIVGYAQLLEMGMGGQPNEAQLRHLGRIRSSSEHLLRLIQDILDVSRVEAGQMDVRSERGDLATTVGAAVTMIQPQVVELGQHLALDCGHDDIEYLGDTARVEQVILNLVGNASKFTEPGGRIRVSCERLDMPDPKAELSSSGPWAAVHVEDTGIGIADNDLDSLFQPFVQLDAELTRQRGGTGLGLAISRDLARLMGGDITVSSEPGEGSTFTLWIPSPDDPPVTHPASDHLLSLPEVNHPEAFRLVGETLPLVESAVIGAYVARLRQDDEVPEARHCSEPQLEDHAASFLSDIAQSLVVLEDGEADVEMLRDSSDIQRVISQLHGAQRARLGWSEAALQREFTILEEEVERAIRATLPENRSDGVDAAVDVLLRLVEQARRVSLLGFKAAQHG